MGNCRKKKFGVSERCCSVIVVVAICGSEMEVEGGEDWLRRFEIVADERLPAGAGREQRETCGEILNRALRLIS